MARRNTGLTTTKLFSQLRQVHTFCVMRDVDGALWATDKLWMVKVLPAQEKLLNALLADYNLPLEPMVCEVGRTLRRIEAKPPELAPILKGIPKKAPALIRHSVGGFPIFIRTDGTRWAGVWTADDHAVTLDAEKVTFVEDLAGPGEWFSGGNSLSPCSLRQGRDVVALLMPIRGLTDLTVLTQPREVAA